MLFKDSLCGGEVDRDIAYEINVSVIWAICTKQNHGEGHNGQICIALNCLTMILPCFNSMQVIDCPLHCIIL